MIAIKVSKGDRQPRPSRSGRSALNRPAPCDVVPCGNKQYQQRDPEERAARRAAGIPKLNSHIEFARELGHKALPSAITFRDYIILEVAGKGVRTQGHSEVVTRSSRTFGCSCG